VIFVDTGPFLARWLARDKYHARAVASWNVLSGSWTPLLTTSHVLDEAITLTARRAGNRFAAERARSLLASRALTIARPDDAVERRALDWLERYHDQRFSFTDCLSFEVMRIAGVREAFTYDDHFRIAGIAIVEP